MYIFESQGKNRAEAEEIALETLGLKSGDVDFETVSPGKSGIFGFGSKKPAVVRVVPVEDRVPVEAMIKGVVLTIVAKLGIESEIKSVSEKDGNIYVEITSSDSGILIGKHGRTLDSLQFIVNLLVDSRLRDNRRIMLDVESYREKRQASLERLAKGVASRVARSRQSVALEYMNPYERRIIHLALEDDDRVFTRSDGNGVYKRVRVIPNSPKGRGGRGDDRDYNDADVDEDTEVEDDIGNRREDYPEDDEAIRDHRR